MKCLNTLILIFLHSLGMFGQVSPCGDNSTSQSDTTIRLGSGAEVKMNKCDFFEVRNCIEISSIQTLDEIERNNISMIDNQGFVLLTCGMLKISFDSSEDCSGLKCLDSFVIIRIPARGSQCGIYGGGINYPYKLDSKGHWELIKMYNEVTDSSGRKYFEFRTKCPAGIYNCDQRMSTNDVKFKAKRYKEIISLKVTSRCPPMSVTSFPKRRNRIVKAKIPCISPDSLFLTVKVSNNENLIETIEGTLSSIKSRFTKSNCIIKSRKVQRRILGIFPLYERNVYRKYIVD